VGAAHALKERGRISSEIAQGMNVFANVDHAGLLH
jgi:hypothetical protein